MKPTGSLLANGVGSDLEVREVALCWARVLEAKERVSARRAAVTKAAAARDVEKPGAFMMRARESVG